MPYPAVLSPLLDIAMSPFATVPLIQLLRAVNRIVLLQNQLVKIVNRAQVLFTRLRSQLRGFICYALDFLPQNLLQGLR